MRSRAFILALFLACGSAELGFQDQPGAPGPSEIRRAEVVATIGDGETGVVFGSVSGLAIDDSGHLFVADEQAHDVRAFGSDGRYLTTIATRGEGPGEVELPWRLRFDSEGRLWVPSLARGRLSVFELEGPDAVGVETVPLRTYGSIAAVPIPSADSILVPVFLPGDDSDWSVGYRIIDRSGVEHRLIPLPKHPATDSVVASGRVEIPRPGREPVVAYGFEPYAPRVTWAVAGNGSYAHALTSRYQIEVFDPTGSHRATIQLAVDPPPVTPEERDSAFAALEPIRDRARQLGGTFEEPKLNQWKPVIRALWFDQENRLWVERWQHHDADSRRADVHDLAGQALFAARWPLRVSLFLGAANDDYLAGTETDELGVQRVVLLRLQ